jgi:hypothetical protein
MHACARRVHGQPVLAALALLALGCSSFALADDPFRCGSKLVSTGLTKNEVVAMCGQPAERKTEEVPLMVRNANGTMRQNGTVVVERWTYSRGNSQFPALLEFQEGKLRRIELKRD